MNEETKFCKDCKHCDQFSIPTYGTIFNCKKSFVVDLVTGYKKMHECEHVMASSGICKEEGILFEPAPESNSIAKSKFHECLDYIKTRAIIACMFNSKE